MGTTFLLLVIAARHADQCFRSQTQLLRPVAPLIDPLVDPATGKRSTETDDVDAYDLILKDKERLLSFAEPVRFIFSHSALR